MLLYEATLSPKLEDPETQSPEQNSQVPSTSSSPQAPYFVLECILQLSEPEVPLHTDPNPLYSDGASGMEDGLGFRV